MIAAEVERGLRTRSVKPRPPVLFQPRIERIDSDSPDPAICRLAPPHIQYLMTNYCAFRKPAELIRVFCVLSWLDTSGSPTAAPNN